MLVRFSDSELRHLLKLVEIAQDNGTTFMGQDRRFVEEERERLHITITRALNRKPLEARRSAR
jgi:hypothetical protein